MFPEITWRPEWCLDTAGTLCNNTAYILPTDDLWVLAVANAPITWWFAWRRAIHGKDEVLRFIKAFAQDLPIPPATQAQRNQAGDRVRQLCETAVTQQHARRMFLDWLRVEYEIEKPGNKLHDMAELDPETLVSEVRRIRGRELPLSAAGVKGLRDEYTHTIEPARTLAAEALKLEIALSDLVNQAYGLTTEEIALMWKTAPPRMPIPPPTS